MIQKFVNICNNNKSKDAFRYLRKNKIITKTFEELLNDAYRYCNLFNYLGLEKKEKIIVFLLPSYEFYTLLIAGMMYGINLVIIDDFREKNKVKLMVESVKSKYVFVNNKTKLVAKFIFNGLKLININSFLKYKCAYFKGDINKNDICLTTFTSGTTGIPKVINRTFSDLEKQVELIYNNFTIDQNDVNICMLPIYVLFSLFNGNTTCIIKKINNKNIRLLKGNIILGKINKILKIKDRIIGIKKLYLGGAYIYKNEAKRIIEIFPQTEINYIYGASEGVVIGINYLNDFLQYQRFNIVKGINVNIIDSVNGIGEIVINGKSVLSKDLSHKTGDIGFIDKKYIYVYGRKKYSSLTNLFYNYLADERIRERYNLNKAFTLWYNDRIVVFYSGKRKINGLIKIKRFPYDLKHKTKVDYNKLIEKYLH